jgi:hypothetical protein
LGSDPTLDNIKANGLKKQQVFTANCRARFLLNQIWAQYIMVKVIHPERRMPQALLLSAEFECSIPMKNDTDHGG